YKGDDLFIIGGREIYREALPYCKYLYITFIEKEYEGNVYFPKVNFDNYKIISEEKLGELTFTVFERR
ncbi:MAG TPA: dihydrofolate reductase, partial [Bacilli bacterium]|nr:dihydrofolate reductase [Bacilli bacterium]